MNEAAQDIFPTVDELLELRHNVTSEQVRFMRHHPLVGELHRIDFDPATPTAANENLTDLTLNDKAKWITRVLPSDEREIRHGGYADMYQRGLEILRTATTPSGAKILVRAHLRAHRDYTTGQPTDRSTCKALRDQYTPVGDEYITSVTVKWLDMGRAAARKVMDFGTDAGRLFRYDPQRPVDLRRGKSSGILNGGKGEFRAVQSGANIHHFANAYTGQFVLLWDEKPMRFKPERDLGALNEQKAFGGKPEDIDEKPAPTMYEADPYPYKLPELPKAS